MDRISKATSSDNNLSVRRLVISTNRDDEQVVHVFFIIASIPHLVSATARCAPGIGDAL
jgi:hypothetical protein